MARMRTECRHKERYGQCAGSALSRSGVGRTSSVSRRAALANKDSHLQGERPGGGRRSLRIFPFASISNTTIYELPYDIHSENIHSPNQRDLLIRLTSSCMNFSDLVAPPALTAAAVDNSRRRLQLLLLLMLGTCRRISCPSTRVVVVAIPIQGRWMEEVDCCDGRIACFRRVRKKSCLEGHRKRGQEGW